MISKETDGSMKYVRYSYETYNKLVVILLRYLYRFCWYFGRDLNKLLRAFKNKLVLFKIYNYEQFKGYLKLFYWIFRYPYSLIFSGKFSSFLDFLELFWAMCSLFFNVLRSFFYSRFCWFYKGLKLNVLLEISSFFLYFYSMLIS